MTVILSDEQTAALLAIEEWYGNRPTTYHVPPPFRLFGPAGTGKTTLARHIGPALGAGIQPSFGTYTGKAAHVLRSKGVPATTIHSAIYRPTGNQELTQERDRLRTVLDDLKREPAQGEHAHADYSDDIGEIESRLAEVEHEMKQATGFRLRNRNDAEWGWADLIVLDECSMVDARMAADIESFGVPVLVLGDPFQLPPIGGAGHYTNAAPDVLLKTIHRQALESPVLRLATSIRTDPGMPSAGKFVTYETASVSRMLEHDQVICWRNDTRWKIIRVLRKRLGHPEGRPVAGDRVMCVTNNKDAGVLNGQQFDVLNVESAWDGDAWAMTVRESGVVGGKREILAWRDGFEDWEGEQRLKARRAFRGLAGAFTFANAITAHKAQGSEWERVYVIDETQAMIEMTARREGMAAAQEQARRWLYTATTRAKESVQLARLKA